MVVELSLRACAPVLASFETVLGKDIYERALPLVRYYMSL